MQYDELYHHGIKGMHWGIRRTPEELGHAPTGGRKKLSEGMKEIRSFCKKNGKRAGEAFRRLSPKVKSSIKDTTKELVKLGKSSAEKVWKSNPKHMTDDELRTKIARMKLEKEYMDLKEKMASPLAKTGREALKNMSSSLGKSLETVTRSVGNMAEDTVKTINRSIGEATSAAIKDAFKEEKSDNNKNNDNNNSNSNNGNKQTESRAKKNEDSYDRLVAQMKELGVPMLAFDKM